MVNFGKVKLGIGVSLLVRGVEGVAIERVPGDRRSWCFPLTELLEGEGIPEAIGGHLTSIL